jgi:hypothetical protein
LLVSLRPSTRATLPASTGLTDLTALPLYDLELDVNPEAHTFTVREELWFTNTESAPMSELVLRLYANTPHRTSAGAVVLPPIRYVRGHCTDAQQNPVICTIASDNPAIITVQLPQGLPPQGRIRVNLSLDGRLDTIDSSRTNMLAAGMESLSAIGGTSNPGDASATDYGLLAVGDNIACLAQWYPVLAPRRAGQWVRQDSGSLGDLGSDELANVDARVSFPDGYRVFTTGVTTHENVSSSGGAATAGTPSSGSNAPPILRNPKRTFSVSAALVRDFTVLGSRVWQTAERRVGDVVVRSHFLPAERTAGERVLDSAAGALAVYERRFGPYPYQDLDVCEAAVVGGAGGVEFAGLVTVASMFYRPPDLSGDGMGAIMQSLGAGGAGGTSATDALNESRESTLEFITAHEVAHQYWHGLVGSDSREHPFVDEALAQFSAIVYLEDRYGAQRARHDGDANVRTNYQILRALGQDDQVANRPVSSFHTPLAYAGIVYGKAPYFYDAARRLMGEQAFFTAMQGYVRDNAFRMAPPDAIVNALARGTQAPRVRALARRWLDETHGDEDLGRASLGQMAARMMGITDPARVREMEQTFSWLERSGLLRALTSGGLSGILGGNGSANNGTNNGGLSGLGGLLQNGNGSGSSGGGIESIVQSLMQSLGGASSTTGSAGHGHTQHPRGSQRQRHGGSTDALGGGALGDAIRQLLQSQ